MNVGRELDFGGQGDEATGEGRGIGLLEGELQMRRFGTAGDFFAQFGEKLGDDVIAGKPFAIFGLEELLANDAFGVDEEISGARHSLELADGFGVQHLIGANGLRIGVGQQRKIDFAAVGEKFQDFGAVVADGGELDPLLLKSGFGCLQLDQLPLAVGSPVGGTEKEKNGALRASERFQRLLRAKLIASRKRGRLLAYGQSDARERLERGNVNGVAVERAFHGDAIAQVAGGLSLWVEIEHQPEGIVV